jgi:hypothetical protein
MLATKRRHAEQLDREEDGERNVGTASGLVRLFGNER